MPRYFTLSSYIRERYGRRVQKVPLDAGFDCPNRDGTLSRNGCVYCNPSGSGTGLWSAGKSLKEQWDLWSDRLGAKYKTDLFWAYLQSFSNTHGPLDRLRKVLDELLGFQGLAGICLGTRPDCLDTARLELMAGQPVDEFWLDLGLQSSNDQTLKRINRGHDSLCFAWAASAAADCGLKVCAHVIAGLPGESREDFLGTVDFVNRLPVSGIKIHNLYVCKGTPLARSWRDGRFRPLERDTYLEWLCFAVARLRPDIVIHRLNGDPRGGELLAPSWAADKRVLLQAFRSIMEERDLWQGKKYPLDSSTTIPRRNLQPK